MFQFRLKRRKKIMCLKSIRKQINSMNEKEYYMLRENDITQFSSHSSGFTVQFSQFNSHSSFSGCYID